MLGKRSPHRSTVVDEGRAAPRFDAYIASAKPDRQAANGIQKALRQIGRCPGQLRALSVHSPDVGNSAGNHGTAVEHSQHLIAVLSPAASSAAGHNADIAH